MTHSGVCFLDGPLCDWKPTSVISGAFHAAHLYVHNVYTYLLLPFHRACVPPPTILIDDSQCSCKPCGFLITLAKFILSDQTAFCGRWWLMLRGSSKRRHILSTRKSRPYIRCVHFFCNSHFSERRLSKALLSIYMFGSTSGKEFVRFYWNNSFARPSPTQWIGSGRGNWWYTRRVKPVWQRRYRLFW